MTIDYLAEAEALRDELIDRRRDFHRHPELAYQEHRTAGIVAEELNNLGLEVQTGVGKTGVIGILEGANDGPTILYRADMDALPIQEENQAEYVSQAAGVMHACGHDGHTAIALGIAKLLTNHRERLGGRVKFVFQPAEEVGSGASSMIDDGALESPAPDRTLGIHLWNDLEVGTVSVVDGPTMSGAGVFEITVTGKGGHGAMPHQTADPIVCSAQIIVALQSIVSRNIDPLDTVVLTIGELHGGSARNIIPQTVSFSGSFRLFREETRDMIKSRIHDIATGVARGMACRADVNFGLGIGAIVNDVEVAARARSVFSGLGDAINVVRQPWMASEDVGLFMQRNPSAYLLVGSANHGRELDFPHHHPRFDFDEDVLPLSVGMMSALIADYLGAGA
ncbi:MAG: M20 family metallopeptidase [Chloroflexota bacterium]|nr:M20 family metallopeptidase [Chloroflexota bacterium]